MAFQKGVSGNPGGKRREKIITDALMVELKHAHDGEYRLPRGATNAQAIAHKLVEKAVAGDSFAIKEITDRVEGKADANLNVEHTGSVTHEHKPVSETAEFIANALGLGTVGAPKESLH